MAGPEAFIAGFATGGLDFFVEKLLHWAVSIVAHSEIKVK
jgi:hypothetical protein